MLEFFTKHENDAFALLKKDHDTVKELFSDFEEAETLRQKKKIVADTIMELKIHATIEEEIFYPALRKHKVDMDLLNEADEEHHVAKLLVAELEQMDGTEQHYGAKYTVLAENIKHHIKEEEGELFPKARKTDLDFVALGKQLLARKQQLKKSGVPPCAEEKMIFAHKKGSGDSPAQTAKRTSSSAVPKKKPRPTRLVSKKSAPVKKVITKQAPKANAKSKLKSKRG